MMTEFALCLNTSTIRPAPLLEKVRVAGRAGYDAIEPWNDEIDEYVRIGGSLTKLRQAIDDEGLKVVSMIALGGWTTPDPTAYRQALDECNRRFEQAAALGSSYIVASPPQQVINLEFAARRYADLLLLGRQHGVVPAMEFLGFVDGVRSLPAAWAIAAGWGDASACIVADVFHLLRGGGRLDDLGMIDGRRMAIFHINDVPASPPVTEQADGDRVMLGEGVADLPCVIELLRAIGYRGPLSLELFNEDLWRIDPLDVAMVGIERLRGLVEG
jgi:sugar phosphate isomerase/epimerase